MLVGTAVLNFVGAFVAHRDRRDKPTGSKIVRASLRAKGFANGFARWLEEVTRHKVVLVDKLLSLQPGLLEYALHVLRRRVADLDAETSPVQAQNFPVTALAVLDEIDDI